MFHLQIKFATSSDACWNEKCLYDFAPILQTWKLCHIESTWNCISRVPWWCSTLLVSTRLPASWPCPHDLREIVLRVPQVFRLAGNWRCRNRTGMRLRKRDCDDWEVDLLSRILFGICDTGSLLQTQLELRRVTSSSEVGKPWNSIGKYQLWHCQSNVKMSYCQTILAQQQADKVSFQFNLTRFVILLSPMIFGICLRAV